MATPRDDYRVMVKKRFHAMPHEDYGTFRTYSAADLLAVEVPAPRQGDRWGPWVYHARSRELIHEREGYPIDLDRCSSCAALLDTIFHVSGNKPRHNFVDASADFSRPYQVIVTP